MKVREGLVVGGRPKPVVGLWFAVVARPSFKRPARLQLSLGDALACGTKAATLCVSEIAFYVGGPGCLCLPMYTGHWWNDPS